MEDPSYCLGGDLTVQPSASEDAKKRKRANDKKYRDRKKQETEDNKKELERIKAENAELKKWVKNYAESEKNYAKLEKNYAKLEENYAKLEKNYADLEKKYAALEKKHGQLKNCMDQQPTRIKMCQPSFQLHERTLDNTFATREAVLPVHHTPVYPSGIAMRSGGSTTIESIEIRQSRVPQEWAHENDSELLVPTHEDSSKLRVPTDEDQSLNIDHDFNNNDEI